MRSLGLILRVAIGVVAILQVNGIETGVAWIDMPIATPLSRIGALTGESLR